MTRSCSHIDVPLVIEFELWRQRQIELAKARGEDMFLPSDSFNGRATGGDAGPATSEA
jgi:hypothetical protein